MDKKLEKIKLDLLRLRHVQGVGENVDGGLEVYVSQKVPLKDLKRKDIVPQFVSNRKTNVTETGYFVAHELTSRERPCPGGYSIGHPRITAGTLGVWFKDHNDGKWKILSNNHVMANQNNCKIGDPIYQPGKHDGGDATDAIAWLSAFEPIKWRQSDDDDNGCPFAAVFNWFLTRLVGYKAIKQADDKNYIDAAIAESIDDNYVKQEIEKIGIVSGILKDIEPGHKVRKTGRTTEYKTGSVEQTGASVLVGYGTGRTALFVDQYITTNISAPGDSGSVVVDRDSQKFVGLLFAGSDTRTIVNPISYVQDAFNIKL